MAEHRGGHDRVTIHYCQARAQAGVGRNNADWEDIATKFLNDKPVQSTSTPKPSLEDWLGYNHHPCVRGGRHRHRPPSNSDKEWS